MGVIGKVRQKIKSAWLGYKIKRGWAQRGRTNMAGIRLQTRGDTKPQAMLTARHLRKNPETGEYDEIDQRVAHGKVTDVFVQDVVDSLVAAAYLNDYKYHDSGTGVGAESEGDTALGTPCGEARDAGSQAEGASANIYKTIATHTYAGPFAITEHGVFDAASAGILMDRSVFSAINVLSGDKIEFTYELTIPSAG